MEFTSLRHLLEYRTANTPQRDFLFSEADGRSWSYEEFNAAVNRTANMLLGRGIGKGDVVSLLLPNSAEYIIAYFACWKIGAIAGPVNSLLKTEEIEWVINNSESKLLLIGDTGGNPAGREGVGILPSIEFNDVEAATTGLSSELAETDVSENDEAIIIYTSGTTGKPKGCLLTHGNLIANARQITQWLGFGPEDRLLTIMPLFHMNAVTVTTMTALNAGGSTVVSPKFSASRFWDIIEKYGVTSFGSVATMLSMILAKADTETRRRGDSEISASPRHRVTPSQLRFAMCGSAPVPAEVLKRFEETFGVLVIEGYGLSESTCRSTFNPPNTDRRPGSCGLPIGNEMRVVDDEDNEVPDGTLGEIVLRGPNIFKGYFRNPEATEKAFAGGWFHTGDLAVLEADRYVKIKDRSKDIIISGGENISSIEVEDALYRHPAVLACAVVARPDPRWGETPLAFVELKPGASVGAEELVAHCRSLLAGYKIPREIRFEPIPKTSTGKIQKFQLRERAKSSSAIE